MKVSNNGCTPTENNMTNSSSASSLTQIQKGQLLQGTPTEIFLSQNFDDSVAVELYYKMASNELVAIPTSALQKDNVTILASVDSTLERCFHDYPQKYSTFCSQNHHSLLADDEKTQRTTIDVGLCKGTSQMNPQRDHQPINDYIYYHDNSFRDGRSHKKRRHERKTSTSIFIALSYAVIQLVMNLASDGLVHIAAGSPSIPAKNGEFFSTVIFFFQSGNFSPISINI